MCSRRWGDTLGAGQKALDKRWDAGASSCENRREKGSSAPGYSKRCGNPSGELQRAAAAL